MGCSRVNLGLRLQQPLPQFSEVLQYLVELCVQGPDHPKSCPEPTGLFPASILYGMTCRAGIW